MKKNPAKLTHKSSLLFLLLLFAAAHARAQTPQPAKTPGVFMHVAVAQGQVHREHVFMTSDCQPNHISVRSGAEFFQFEQPTDSLPIGAGMPVNLVARIDATKLEPKLYSFPLLLSCQHCEWCRLESKLTVEVEVVKPATPQAELDELSRNGPAFPAAYDMNDFSFRALFKWGWKLKLVFELAQPGTVRFTAAPDGYAPPFEQTTPRLEAGLHELPLTLPEAARVGRPDVIIAATYSVKAVTEGTPAEGVDPFLPLSITLGEPGARLQRGDAVVPAPGGFAPLAGARLVEASYGPAPGAYGVWQETIDFSPREVQVAGDRPSANVGYGFRAHSPYSRVEARVLFSLGDNKWVAVSSRDFNAVGVGDTVRGEWDCMKDGAPSLGRHRLMVLVWETPQEGAHSAVQWAPNSVIVRR
jgi:hypothetical protein